MNKDSVRQDGRLTAKTVELLAFPGSINPLSQRRGLAFPLRSSGPADEESKLVLCPIDEHLFLPYKSYFFDSLW